MSVHVDLVIRNGSIIDGSGADPYTGDLFIKDGKIFAIGNHDYVASQEIDAGGYVVTPGFVDIHTHYDGHATWTSHLNPSSAHGVTTVLLGNCGVGFAPCRVEDRERLVSLMEGVEDIPKVVMTEGLPWTWESFPEYLDYLDSRQYDMDIATQLPHAPLRVFVMGERAANKDPATTSDIEKMRTIAFDAIKAGALGFSTSRSLNHRASNGDPTPSILAASDELAGIVLGLRDAGQGVVQFISDFEDLESEFSLVERMVDQSGRPLSLSLLQFSHAPDRWRHILDKIEQANKNGKQIRAQVCGRPVGILAGLELNYNPFSFCETYNAISALPLEQRLEKLRQPEIRDKILKEFPGHTHRPMARSLCDVDKIFLMNEIPNYEPSKDDSIGATARRAGVDPLSYTYDKLLEDGGKTVFYVPAANYYSDSIAAAEEMLNSDCTVLGLGDGGAHCGIICDASLPTYMLVRWADSGQGNIPLALVIKALTSETAETVGLHDRGRLAVGYRADINIIDLDKIKLHRPRMIYDLPRGGGRLHQVADGYVATIVKGEITYRDGVETGNLPGRLIRGAQSVPLHA